MDSPVLMNILLMIIIALLFASFGMLSDIHSELQNLPFILNWGKP